MAQYTKEQQGIKGKKMSNLVWYQIEPEDESYVENIRGKDYKEGSRWMKPCDYCLEKYFDILSTLVNNHGEIDETMKPIYILDSCSNKKIWSLIEREEADRRNQELCRTQQKESQKSCKDILEAAKKYADKLLAQEYGCDEKDVLNTIKKRFGVREEDV